ncbi:MAG: translational machinery protein [Polyangiales bacterium]
MTTHRHAAVWLDHHEARIFHVDADGSDKATIRAPHQHVHRHPGNGNDRAHPHEPDHFFHDVAGALLDAGDVLVVGPSTAKLQFMRYLRAQAPKIEAKVVGIETVDHPSDAQLVDYTKRYFDVPPPRVQLKD